MRKDEVDQIDRYTITNEEVISRVGIEGQLMNTVRNRKNILLIIT
jgi:hypothetical protein